MLEVGSSGLAAWSDGNLCGGQGSDGGGRLLLLVLESFLMILYYYGYFISSLLLSLLNVILKLIMFQISRWAKKEKNAF